MNKVRGFEKISIQQWNKDTLVNGTRNINICNYSNIVLPNRKTANSAGYDIFSTMDFILKPNEHILIPTGFKVYMLYDEKLVFHPRSSLGFKYFIRLANTTGIGDSDYYDNIDNEGHYWVKIRNEGDKEYSARKGDSIAQCIFEKYLLADNDTFDGGNKRVGGLGSTGN